MRGYLTALVGGWIGAVVLGAGVGLALAQIPSGDGMDGLAWVAMVFLAAAAASLVGAGVGTALALRRVDGRHSTAIGWMTSVLLLVTVVPVVWVTDMGAWWALGPFVAAPVAARWLVLSRRPRGGGDGLDGFDAAARGAPPELPPPPAARPGRTPPATP